MATFVSPRSAVTDPSHLSEVAAPSCACSAYDSEPGDVPRDRGLHPGRPALGARAGVGSAARRAGPGLRKADALDARRQAALRQIFAGRPPALARDACPFAALGLDWPPRPGFAAPPRDWETLTRYGSTWSWESATGRMSSIERAAPSATVESRRHEHLRLRVHNPDDWIARRKVWMTPDEARQEGRDWTGVDRWDHDATLVIDSVAWPRQNHDGTWDLGALDGSFWIWSYGKQAFVCGGGVHIAHDTAPESVGNLSAGYWPDGLKMRTAAVAMEGLHAVTTP
jgi:hypothetical protein